MIYNSTDPDALLAELEKIRDSTYTEGINKYILIAQPAYAGFSMTPVKIPHISIDI